MLSLRFLTALLFAAICGACTLPVIPDDAQTTILALRHADRSGDELSSKGQVRAKNLPAAVAAYDLDAIYSPDIARKIATAEPLSQATSLPITLIPKEYAGARMTQEHPDGTVLWVGNKDNLRALWSELGAQDPAPQNYGELFVVKMQGKSAASVTRLHVPAGLP